MITTTLNGPTTDLYSGLVQILTLLIFAQFPSSDAQNCRPTGYFRATSPPPGKCSFGCCIPDQVYFTFQCSPDVTSRTSAVLAFDTFKTGFTCGGGSYNPKENPATALLSTGWYGGGKRCGKEIVVRGVDGRIVRATVVGECDSTAGCDQQHGFRPPCGYDVVVGSKAVWRALGLNQSSQAQFDVTWSET